MLKHSPDLFDLENHVYYLNNAYMSPNLKSVEMAGRVGIRSKTRPYNINSEDFFKPVDNLKRSFAQVINCPDHHSIAIIPSASYGLANVAANLDLGRKKNIVLPSEIFPSNYYVWERLAKDHQLELRIVAPPESLDNRGAAWNEAIVNAIDEDTLLVACGHVHWVDGTLFDLVKFRQACDAVDAYLIVDGTQSVGALPIDVSEIKPDALICAGYKWLFGPYGIGFAYYGEKFLDGKPIEENWANRLGSDDFKNLVAFEGRYHPGAARYSVGESGNFILVPMMQTALDQVNAWKPERLQDYSGKLVGDYLEAFRAMGCWIEQEDWRCNHLLGIRLPDHVDIDEVSQNLRNRNIHVSIRGNSIRVATSIYNSKRELDQFLSVLHRAKMV